MGIAGAVGNPGEVAATRGVLAGSRENRSAIGSESGTPTICSSVLPTETRAGRSEAQLASPPFLYCYGEYLQVVTGDCLPKDFIRNQRGTGQSIRTNGSALL